MSASGSFASEPSRTAASCAGRCWLSSGSGAGRSRQVAHQHRDGRVHRRLRPVVPGAVAQAVGSGEQLLLRRSRIVGPPVAGIAQHRRLERLAHARPALRRHPLGLDRGQREHRLAQREGQPRPDLQDREVRLDQRPQGTFGLVVRRVGLVGQPRVAQDRGREVGRLGRVEVDHARVPELDAGLDHDGDHALPGRL